ncbi:MAG: NAD-dependent epimerase/dehydratase family protein [SAR324 cluster bacterium]|nr:NAD-dependent epimerase/dehydratase family protein [SAR324 cluster bacterium]
MNILLTGHEGYVGVGLFNYLSTNHSVTGWGRKQDILSITPEILKKQQITAVVNCATVMDRISPNFVLNSESDRVNIEGMKPLVRAVQELNIPLIHISTKDVFGDCFSCEDVKETPEGFRPKFLVDDNQPFSPQTIYAKTKLISEFITETHSKSVVIRLSSCYTDFDHHRGNWIVNIIKTLFKGESPRVTNTGRQFRDLLHVHDLGILIEQILESKKYGVKINAGGGVDNIYSILQIIRMILPSARIAEIDGGDYGFAFNNRLANECYHWHPKILFKERLPLIKKNIQEHIKE